MFFSIPLKHDIDHYCNKIDEHIREDFETKIPDYGADAFNPIGFHFKRKDNKVRGFYRSKYVKFTGGAGAFLSPSTHMHFIGKMTEDETGEKKLRVFVYPQLTQAFMLVISIIFVILFSRNIAETYLYVILFASLFLYSLVETVRLTSLINKEFKKFFN